VRESWARSYWAAWAIWVGVMSAAFVAAAYMADPRYWMNAWRGVCWIAVAGLVVALLCWKVTRNRAAEAAILYGFLVGAGCFAIFVLYGMLRSHDSEARAFALLEMVVGGIVSGVGGAVIGALNRKIE
jgi:Na+/proline symporter